MWGKHSWKLTTSVEIGIIILIVTEMGERRIHTMWRVKKVLLGLLTAVVAACSVGTLGVLALSVALTSGSMESAAGAKAVDVAIMDRYDMYMTNAVSNALEGVLAIDKVYWLSDDDQVAPEPDQSKFGHADDPAAMQWFLDAAQPLLDGQDTVFTTETKLKPNTKVQYYLDDTIMVITWKQPVDNCIYTFSEVKIAHPSQFRRFLAGGAFGSPIQLTTTEMAASVNAVVASSGDFYMFRRHGVIVYDGIVQRCDTTSVETCFITDKGDLMFSRRGELADMESAQAFVDENNIRFGMAFGPILIENGAPTTINGYILGEIYEDYCRAALCQMDELHYLLVVANTEAGYHSRPNIFDFQKALMEFDCGMAYTLDGGQTAVIAMNDQLINNVVYGYQRNISDIIYFATAIPDGN